MLSRLNINQLDCQNIDRQGLRRKVQQQVDHPQQQRTPWTFWGGKTEVQVIIIVIITIIIITALIQKGQTGIGERAAAA